MTDPFLDRVRELRRQGFDLHMAWACAERELDVKRPGPPATRRKGKG